MQLKVVKSDGTVEEYFHTKLIGTLNNVLDSQCSDSVFIAEKLAEAATYYLYHSLGKSKVSSGEILEVLKAVLASSGYEQAAEKLSEYNYKRAIQRKRIEVMDLELKDINDRKKIDALRANRLTERWNKSIIVNDLKNKYEIDIACARTIAAVVEQQVLNMEISLIPKSLIRQLVLLSASGLLNAEEKLNSRDITEPKKRAKSKDDIPGTEAPLRQQQKGLCTVEV